MLVTSVLTLLSLGATSLAWDWDKSGRRGRCYEHKSTVNYTTVNGLFLQDDLATDPKSFDYTTVNYGLINRSYPTDKKFDPYGKKTQWQRFEHYVDTLNRDANKDTQYKVLFLARHGEGYHNAAESYYGTPAWNVGLFTTHSPQSTNSSRSVLSKPYSVTWGPLDGNGTAVLERRTPYRGRPVTMHEGAQLLEALRRPARATWRARLATAPGRVGIVVFSLPLCASAIASDEHQCDCF
ncbi:hypothetical protein NUW58_g3766 [Xylaria curta]|uniref:Uncharacterized protein n=1 Tax=Xylaria curta TaxID=42375 RepID=A0ACC1P9W9_9PEZI|nr:hypothetical protein NUW58_g3766 [Xylaria curta]